MNYIGTIGEKEVRVSVRETGVARYAVTIDGQEHLVDAHQVQSSVWSVLYGETSFEVDVQGKDEEFEVLISGDCYKFTLMNEQRRAMIRAGGKGAAGKAMVTSPMPGKVVKLLVKEGQEVKADQGVIVVEAMKMENELKSAVAGKVKEIFVKEGEVVESGAKLLLVE
ncbi:MAG: acetyl-CoA carboxylase biotin carboxyl carrier protein subunit [Deltaproteobacteria bacterium]|nr:MAG: acetyl-CoA carboxylase biotin carboxyl carrier protein subunit [Deltaproteobacteria bacterium]